MNTKNCIKYNTNIPICKNNRILSIEKKGKSARVCCKTKGSGNYRNNHKKTNKKILRSVKNKKDLCKIANTVLTLYNAYYSTEGREYKQEHYSQNPEEIKQKQILQLYFDENYSFTVKQMKDKINQLPDIVPKKKYNISLAIHPIIGNKFYRYALNIYNKGRQDLPDSFITYFKNHFVNTFNASMTIELKYLRDTSKKIITSRSKKKYEIKIAGVIIKPDLTILPKKFLYLIYILNCLFKKHIWIPQPAFLVYICHLLQQYDNITIDILNGMITSILEKRYGVLSTVIEAYNNYIKFRKINIGTSDALKGHATYYRLIPQYIEEKEPENWNIFEKEYKKIQRTLNKLPKKLKKSDTVIRDGNNIKYLT